MNACDERSMSIIPASAHPLWNIPEFDHDHKTQEITASPGIAADAATVENRKTGL